jgi:hypothetical protein
VATVDPDDDSIRRFVALHYRYDPARHERRDVVVAAFDHEHELVAFLAGESDALKARQATGDADSHERITGVVLEPGDHETAQDQRLRRRALDHGVWPHDLDPEAQG